MLFKGGVNWQGSNLCVLGRRDTRPSFKKILFRAACPEVALFSKLVFAGFVLKSLEILRMSVERTALVFYLQVLLCVYNQSLDYAWRGAEHGSNYLQLLTLLCVSSLAVGIGSLLAWGEIKAGLPACLCTEPWTRKRAAGRGDGDCRKKGAGSHGKQTAVKRWGWLKQKTQICCTLRTDDLSCPFK